MDGTRLQKQMSEEVDLLENLRNFRDAETEPSPEAAAKRSRKAQNL